MACRVGGGISSVLWQSARGASILLGRLTGGNADPAARAFNSWLNSPKHRQAMEDSRFTHTGLVVAKSSNGRYYFTQLFVLPR